MAEKIDQSDEGKWADAAQEWKAIAASMEKGINSDKWQDIVRGHIRKYLEPMDTLVNDDGDKYGEVYSDKDVKAIFGGVSVSVSGNDVWDQIKLR